MALLEYSGNHSKTMCSLNWHKDIQKKTLWNMSNLTRCQNANILFIQFFPVSFSSWTAQLFQPTPECFTLSVELLKVFLFLYSDCLRSVWCQQSPKGEIKGSEQQGIPQSCLIKEPRQILKANWCQNPFLHVKRVKVNQMDEKEDRN